MAQAETVINIAITQRPTLKCYIIIFYRMSVQADTLNDYNYLDLTQLLKSKQQLQRHNNNYVNCNTPLTGTV